MRAQATRPRGRESHGGSSQAAPFAGKDQKDPAGSQQLARVHRCPACSMRDRMRGRAQDTPGWAVLNGRRIRGVVRPTPLGHTPAGAQRWIIGMLFPDIDVVAGTVTLAIWQTLVLAGLLLLFLFVAIYRADWPKVVPNVVAPAARVGLALFAIVAVW